MLTLFFVEESKRHVIRNKNKNNICYLYFKVEYFLTLIINQKFTFETIESMKIILFPDVGRSRALKRFLSMIVYTVWKKTQILTQLTPIFITLQVYREWNLRCNGGHFGFSKLSPNQLNRNMPTHLSWNGVVFPCVSIRELWVHSHASAIV